MEKPVDTLLVPILIGRGSEGQGNEVRLVSLTEAPIVLQNCTKIEITSVTGETLGTTITRNNPNVGDEASLVG